VHNLKITSICQATDEQVESKQEQMKL